MCSTIECLRREAAAPHLRRCAAGCHFVRVHLRKDLDRLRRRGGAHLLRVRVRVRARAWARVRVRVRLRARARARARVGVRVGVRARVCSAATRG